MRVLWLATKCPWPPADGGRLLLLNTLQALRQAGHEVVLLAPAPREEGEREEAHRALAARCRLELVPVRYLPRWLDLVRALRARDPIVVVRHERPAIARRFLELVTRERFDLVQVEQVHAVASHQGDAGRSRQHGSKKLFAVD